MLPELTENDFVPLAQFQFQHWCDRCGPPYSFIRPLREAAAERVWARVASARAEESGSEALDLGALDDWDASLVKRWLLSRDSDAGRHVLLCYQPRVVVSVPWGIVCEHWLVFFWTAARACADDGAWVLTHDGDRFEFASGGHRA